jgi:hypothetical protein
MGSGIIIHFTQGQKIEIDTWTAIFYAACVVAVLSIAGWQIRLHVQSETFANLVREGGCQQKQEIPNG